MHSLSRTTPRWHLAITLVISLPSLLAACASVPTAIDSLRWNDLWGGRSHQAAQRDWAMCEKLIEQRRGLLASCMAERGWGYADGPSAPP
jgi:hypothetical protein